MSTYVWLAIDMYPESMVVLASGSREGIIAGIRDSIVAREWDEFQEALKRSGEPGSDLSLDDDPEVVVRHFWGDFEPAEDEGDDAVFIGECWLIRRAELIEADS